MFCQENRKTKQDSIYVFYQLKNGEISLTASDGETTKTEILLRYFDAKDEKIYFNLRDFLEHLKEINAEKIEFSVDGGVISLNGKKKHRHV
jgi:DNA polymerase III sliding clamp (beta) subunit (PCNA family)